MVGVHENVFELSASKPFSDDVVLVFTKQIVVISDPFSDEGKIRACADQKGNPTDIHFQLFNLDSATARFHQKEIDQFLTQSPL